MEVIRLARTASTQDVARRLPVGSAVVADHQTAGRGRRGRAWEAPAGTALLASFVLPFHPLGSLAAGVAAAEACAAGVRLKWPNDLLLGGAKVGGILVEVADVRAIVGVGLNLTAAPAGAARLERDRDQLLERLAEELERWFAESPEAVLAAWRERADTLGRRVRAVLGQGGERDVVEGVAEDVAADGALLIGGRRILAADLSYLRPAAEPAPGPGGAARPSVR
jgi:BirA family transcriptional regulator, biotin operon repressor / biotin---[acetyl-CoA-carboxylase] ligase